MGKLKSSHYLFLTKILSIFFIFLFGVLVANAYGEGVYADYIYVQSVFYIMSFIYLMGLDQLVYRELANSNNSDNLKFIKKVLKVKVVSFAFFVLLSFVYVFLNDINSKQYVFLLFITVIFFHASKSFIAHRQLLEIKLKSRIIFFCDITSIVFCCSFSFMLYLLKLDYYLWILWPLHFLISNVAIYFYIYNYNDFIDFGQKGNVKSLSELSSEAKFLLLAILMSSIFMQSDILMLKYFDEKVSVYGVAMSFIQPLLIAPAILSLSFYPKFAYLFNQTEKNDFFVFFNAISNLFFYIGLLFVLVFLIFSGMLVDFFYGDAFLESKNILILLSIIFVFAFPSSLYSKYLLLRNGSSLELYKTSVAACLNIVLNFILIPDYGVYGAVFSSVISYFVSDFVFLLFIKRLSEMRVIILGSVNPFMLPSSIKTIKVYLSE